MSQLTFKVQHIDGYPIHSIHTMTELEKNNKEIIRDWKVFKNGILVLCNDIEKTKELLFNAFLGRIEMD